MVPPVWDQAPLGSKAVSNIPSLQAQAVFPRRLSMNMPSSAENIKISVRILCKKKKNQVYLIILKISNDNIEQEYMYIF